MLTTTIKKRLIREINHSRNIHASKYFASTIMHSAQIEVTGPTNSYRHGESSIMNDGFELQRRAQTNLNGFRESLLYR